MSVNSKIIASKLNEALSIFCNRILKCIMPNNSKDFTPLFSKSYTKRVLFLFIASEIIAVIGKFMKSIYLVRHGQYIEKTASILPKDYSLEQLLTTRDGNLSNLGRVQAKITGNYLSGFEVTSIISSSLNRTKQTAQIISEQIPGSNISLSKKLWECLPSMPPNPSKEVSLLNESDISKSWERIETLYQKYFTYESKNKNSLIIISHGNLIKALVSKLLGADKSSWLKMDVMNCGITRIDINQNEKILFSFNENAHLPIDLKTFS